MEEYSSKAGWEGLEVEPVIYFSGGKYSMYGYKRYDDVRLVLLPELRIGNFGGDPDNFTYPRYNLDMTLWRVYENGAPVNSSDFYFPVNPTYQRKMKRSSPSATRGAPSATVPLPRWNMTATSAIIS